jgi:hypothetical protein
MRRTFVFSAALAVLLPFASACGGGGTTPPTEPAACDVFLTGAAPADTAVVLGGSYALRLSSMPGACAGKPRYEVSSGAVTVDAEGNVTARAYGRARIVATAAGQPQTLWVSVVPPGMLAATRAPRAGELGLDVLHTDLAGFRTLTRPWGVVWGTFVTPRWHPSGSHLVYMEGSRRDIFRLDTLGGQPQKVWARPASIDEALFPVYSRDGAWLYFSASANGQSPLWRMRSDGTGAERVAADAQGSDQPEDVSPDGRWLAYWTNRVYPPVTRFWNPETRQHSASTIPQSGIRYSPSGDSIAYERDLILYVAAADGSGERRLVEGRYYPALSWSPDGQWIAARSMTSIENERLELIQVQTGLAIPLPHTGDLYQPEWNPGVR